MKSKKTKLNIKHLAKLTAIKIKKREEKKLADQLAETVDFFTVLNKLSNGKTKATTSPAKLFNVFREDEVERPLKQREVFQNTQNSRRGFFTTKRIAWEKTEE